MSSRPDLRLDWCDVEAARYAVEHWHYSRMMPRAKSNYLGVWEDGIFIGAVVFGLGGGGATDGRSVGLSRSFDVVELERVALRSHKSPVTRIVRIAMRMIAGKSPGLRLVVSYADPSQGHVGRIYQGGNWVYVGMTEPDYYVVDAAGRRWHSRAVYTGKRKLHFGKVSPGIHINAGTKVETPGKYKYLYPLDDEMRERIAPLAKPYPKRASEASSDAPAIHAGEGGAAPTQTLQHTEVSDG